MKKNQNKLCYFFAFFPPKFLHFCRMTHILVYIVSYFRSFNLSVHFIIAHFKYVPHQIPRNAQDAKR